MWLLSVAPQTFPWMKEELLCNTVFDATCKICTVQETISQYSIYSAFQITIWKSMMKIECHIWYTERKL